LKSFSSSSVKQTLGKRSIWHISQEAAKKRRFEGFAIHDWIMRTGVLTPEVAASIQTVLRCWTRHSRWMGSRCRIKSGTWSGC